MDAEKYNPFHIVRRAVLPLVLLATANLCLPCKQARGQSTSASPAAHQTAAQQTTNGDNSDRKILQDQLGDSVTRRTRLYLKDGTYQVVVRYQVTGNRVRYISAERGDEWEEVPANLVDWDATHKWEKEHVPGAALQTASPVVPLDPEEIKENAEEAASMPEVLPNLFLPEDGGVLALDTFHSTPELVLLDQSTGDLDKQTGHNILKAAINPLASSHQLIQLQGIKSKVQLHVATPVVYVSLGDHTPGEAEPRDFKVDTHGAGSIKGTPSGGSPNSQYLIVRADIRRDIRIIGSFRISMLGQVSQQEDIVETQQEVLPGGRWMKLTPVKPLLFGEYALMEVLNPKEVNLEVWDFGVHPTAPDNTNAILPKNRKPLPLAHP